MANSGIEVDPKIIEEFNAMKLKKGIKAKYILYKISDDDKQIVTHKISAEEATYEEFRKDIDDLGPCYAIYDCDYVTDNGQNNSKLVFVAWCPEGTKIKKKMLIASSKDALKMKLVGIQCELQASDADEISLESFRAKVGKK